MVRCFVAFDVEEPSVVERVSLLQRELSEAGASVKPVDASALHVTIQFLGEVQPERVGLVAEQLSGIVFRPFKVVVRRVGYFPGGGRVNVVWVGLDDVEGIMHGVQREVASRLSKLGFRPDKEFSPHLTILRVKSVHDKGRLLATIKRLEGFEGGEVVLDKLKLKKSVLTPAGPVYSDIEVIPAKA